jgi:alpha/beta superfamily hydrolase
METTPDAGTNASVFERFEQLWQSRGKSKQKATPTPAKRKDKPKLSPLADSKVLAAVKKPNKAMVAPKGSLPKGYNRPPPLSKGLLKQGLDRFMPDSVSEAEENVFGEAKDRKKIDDKTQKQLDLMYATGAAAQLEISSTTGTHKLKGNFYSAKGTNLKDTDGKPDTKSPVVLLLTGSGGSAEDQGLELAKFYRETGASCMSVNYGGYGSSDDANPSEQGCVDDAQDMFEHLLKMGYKPDQIIIHGFSMGGAVAGLLEKNNAKANPKMKMKGAVYDRAMTSVYDAARSVPEDQRVDKLQAKGAEIAVGFKDTKGAIKKAGKATPRVIATDSDFLGPSGDKMRKDLQKKKGAKVEGASSGSDHFDHQAIIGANEDALTKLIHPKGFKADTKEDELDAAERVARQIDEMDQLAAEYESTYRPWKDAQPSILRSLESSLDKVTKDVKTLKQNLSGMDAELLKSLKCGGQLTVTKNRVTAMEKDLEGIQGKVEMALKRKKLAEARKLNLQELDQANGDNLKELQTALAKKDYETTLGLFEHRFGLNMSIAGDIVPLWESLKKQTDIEQAQTMIKLEEVIDLIENPEVAHLLRNRLIPA